MKPTFFETAGILYNLNTIKRITPQGEGYYVHLNHIDEHNNPNKIFISKIEYQKILPLLNIVKL